MRVYNEVGIGLDYVVCYEVEYDNGKEERFKGWYSGSIKEVYVRMWIGVRVLVLSSKNGIEIVKKNKNRFKVVLGFRVE